VTRTRSIPSTVVGTGLTLARLPLDTVLRLGGDRAPAQAVKLAVDRADATVRSVAGIALGDVLLQEDGSRRRAAADERERAMRLHAEAEARTEQADEHVEEARSEARERRESAAESAERRRRQAKERRDALKSQAAKATNRRKQSAKADAARAEEQIEKEARRSKLEHLETKAEALEEREAALVAADEGRRLKRAASKAKVERKKGR
jgi:hypothetical protein